VYDRTLLVEEEKEGDTSVRAALLAICLLILFFNPIAGYNLSSVSIEPSDTLVPGTPVSVIARIDFPVQNGEIFPLGGELQLSTDLENPTWVWIQSLDGMETIHPDNKGRVLALTDQVLSQPEYARESIKIILNGTAPEVSATKNRTSFRTLHISCRSCKDPSDIDYYRIIVNKSEIQHAVYRGEGNLSAFRIHIEEKSEMGIDTSAAEAKYSEANQKIKSAKTRLSTQYVQVYRDLNAAQRAIDDGEVALDRAWAENEVANAQVPINNTDNVIAWFKANNSTADNSHLPAIIGKRDVAMSYIASAHEEIRSGNYSQARAKADEAYKMGNESYSDVLSLQKCVPYCRPDPIYQSIIRAGIVVIILTIIGIIWWKKFPEE
jgi:hypothetical protein